MYGPTYKLNLQMQNQLINSFKVTNKVLQLVALGFKHNKINSLLDIMMVQSQYLITYLEISCTLMYLHLLFRNLSVTNLHLQSLALQKMEPQSYLIIRPKNNLLKLITVMQQVAYASIRMDFSCLQVVMTARLKFGTYAKWQVALHHCCSLIRLIN